MSYSKSFTKTIPVYYSGSKTVSVGDSTTTVHYSGTVYEQVTVNVNVDTDSFDHSIHECNGSVGVLTGSVVATEAAQVGSIREKSRQIGRTIIDGFFSTVQSEISQQIVELTSQIEATLIHLKEMAQRCISKQKQMEVDYCRLASRYSTIFEDLNKELENRIYEIDRPTFKFKEMSDQSACRVIGTDMASTVAVSGPENAHLEALIGASITKKQAQTAIDKANVFLTKQKRTERLLETCSIRESLNAVYHAPVCFIETCGVNSSIGRNIYSSDIVDKSRHTELMEHMGALDYNRTEADKSSLKKCFCDEVAAKYAYANPHDERVRDYITILFNNTL
jgi:hypothetical protein